MMSCFSARYKGEIKDMNMIYKTYHVLDYIEAIEERDKAAGERAEDVIPLLPVAEPELFPRLYRVIDKVLERLGISFRYEVRLLKTRETVFMVAEETGPNDLFLRFSISPEEIATYDDDELAFKFGHILGWQIWGFARFTNLERRTGAIGDGEEYGKRESVLPGMGNELYKRWYLKAQLSADRMGAIAAGSFEASVKALLREDSANDIFKEDRRLQPLRTQDMCVPGIRQFREFEKRRGDARPGDVIYRIRALSFFCEEWFSPMRDDADFKVVDEILDNDFRQIARKVESEDERDVVLAFVYLALKILCANGRSPSLEELRGIVSTLYTDHTEDPGEVFAGGMEWLLKAGRKAYRAIAKHQDGGLRRIVYSDLCTIMALDGRNAEEKGEALAAVARAFDLDEEIALGVRLIATEKNGRNMVDPLLEELVGEIKGKLSGKRCAVVRTSVARRLQTGLLCRYAGDVEGERVLREVYNAETLVRAWVSISSSDSVDSVRNDMLKGGVRLTKKTSPRVFSVIDRVSKRLQMGMPFEVFCRREGEINAHAKYTFIKGKIKGVVVISVEAMERLDDDELAFVIGHEFGHLIHQHGKWSSLEKEVKDGECLTTVLPQMGDIVYREWQQKQEISSDRAGAIAAGNPEAAISALVKVCYGLSGANFNAEGVDELLAQLREIKDSVEVFDSLYETHPLTPLRIKALSLFCDAYYGRGISEQNLESVDHEIDRYYEWIRKYPRTRVHLASMRTFVDGGLEMVMSGENPDDREIARMCYVLNTCTSDPAAEFIGDQNKRRARLNLAVKILRDENDEEVDRSLLGELAILALADGYISEGEHKYILKLAKRIGFGLEDARRLISAKVAEVGFPVDFLLERHVSELKTAIRKNYHERR